jgi:hypothetical protein
MFLARKHVTVANARLGSRLKQEKTISSSQQGKVAPEKARGGLVSVRSSSGPFSSRRFLRFSSFFILKMACGWEYVTSFFDPLKRSLEKASALAHVRLRTTISGVLSGRTCLRQ